VGVSELVPPSENSESAPTMVIWGTDVQVNDCKRKFKRFLETFLDISMTDEERFEGLNPDEPYYMQRLAEINILQHPFLNVDCGHINQFDEDLYRQLICYPQEVIPTFDMAVNEMFFDKFPDTELEHQIQVRKWMGIGTRPKVM
jgi:DNA replication licensing factor MCM4